MARSSPPMSRDKFISFGTSKGWKLIPHKKNVTTEGTILERLNSDGETEKITYWDTARTAAIKTKHRPMDYWYHTTRIQLERMLASKKMSKKVLDKIKKDTYGKKT